MQPQQFIQQALGLARVAHFATRVNTSVILAQWADETGWGGPDWSVLHNPGNVSLGGQSVSYLKLSLGVQAYIYTMMQPQYDSVRNASDWTDQCLALGESPWAASHYDNGNGPGSALVQIILENNLLEYDMTNAQTPPARVYVSIAVTPTGKGYYILDTTGEVYAFGDAEYFGGMTPDGQVNLPTK